MNQPDLLYRAKRDLEKTVDQVKDAARIIWRNAATNGSSPLDYFYANAANKGAFQKRVAAFQKNQLLSIDSNFTNLVISAVTQYQTVEELSAAEKSRKAAKRSAVASKAKLRQDLNLQEGVKLQGVDVGQYQVILSGLEPVRLHVYAARKAHHEENISYLTAQLSKVDYSVERDNPRAAFDDKNIRGTAWERGYKAWTSRDAAVRRWFNVDNKGIASLKPDNAERVEKLAQQFALAYVQGYAVKLALKTGEVLANDLHLHKNVAVVSATVSSRTLWQDSTAAIVIRFESGVEQTLRFHTQIIWNRSCLGKVFNQYPTRRIA